MTTEKTPRACVLCDRSEAEAKHLVGDDKGVVCEQCVGRSMILMCQAGWIPPNVKINISILPIARAEKPLALVEGPKVDAGALGRAVQAVHDAKDVAAQKETPGG